MNYVIISLIWLITIVLSNAGYIAATYVVMSLLILNIVLVTASASFFMSLPDLKNLNVDASFLPNRRIMRFLQQIFMFTACYHVYTLGYVFLAGASLVSITISFIVNATRKTTEHN